MVTAFQKTAFQKTAFQIALEALLGLPTLARSLGRSLKLGLARTLAGSPLNRE